MEIPNITTLPEAKSERCPMRQLRALARLRKAARTVLDDNMKGIKPETRLEEVAVECCDVLDGETAFAEIEDQLGVPENSLREMIEERAGVSHFLDARLSDVIAVAKEGMGTAQETSAEASA